MSTGHLVTFRRAAKRGQVYRLMLCVAWTFILSCHSSNRNKISFKDDISTVQSWLKQTSVLEKKISGEAKSMQFDSTGFYVSGRAYKNLDALTDENIPGFSMFSKSELKDLAMLLTRLSNNNIKSIGITIDGFVVFGYKPILNMDRTDLRFITIDNGKFHLSGRGSKQLDKVYDLVLFSYN